MDDVDEYFSSPSALYQKHTTIELGISKGALINHFSRCKSLGMDLEYINSKCRIEKGILIHKDVSDVIIKSEI